MSRLLTLEGMDGMEVMEGVLPGGWTAEDLMAGLPGGELGIDWSALPLPGVSDVPTVAASSGMKWIRQVVSGSPSKKGGTAYWNVSYRQVPLSDGRVAFEPLTPGSEAHKAQRNKDRVERLTTVEPLWSGGVFPVAPSQPFPIPTPAPAPGLVPTPSPAYPAVGQKKKSRKALYLGLGVLGLLFVAYLAARSR